MLEAALKNEGDSKRFAITADELLVKNTPDAGEESESEADGEEDSEREEDVKSKMEKESKAKEYDERRTKIRKDQYHGTVVPEEPRWELRSKVKGKGVLR
ncbi:hypothetical protein AMTR_s00006p00172180 [Amborella trichopoda]|uniref:Uncharacterized protein n=1 Tax=Amborella trichopoda TaxID=13333 RepID=W1P724_AMBTC|nr:hypothetical protein AMTR_s00006p00172180 [Amborella trichopoda]